MAALSPQIALTVVMGVTFVAAGVVLRSRRRNASMPPEPTQRPEPISNRLATAGLVLLAVGQLIFVWNLVTSWLEGKRVESGDPWNLDRDDVNTREWA